MKTIVPSLCIILLLTLLSACEKQDIEDKKVEENGLSEDINDFIPEEILDEMIAQGMPINRGGNPPNIENTYLATPFILLSSNRPSDSPGSEFYDLLLRFYQQDNNQLTVKLDYSSGIEAGEGVGSFIVGEENKFTVVTDLRVTAYNDTADAAFVFSGTIAEGYIHDLYVANFMINNYGNSSGYFIEEGEGRVFYDEDGMSETTHGLRHKAPIKVPGLMGNNTKLP